MADDPSGGGWYLSLGDEAQGPHDPAEIEAWYREGRIGPAALVWDGAAWRPVGDLFAVRKPPLTPEAERAAIERALSYRLFRPAAAPHRNPLSLAIYFALLLILSLALFLAARRLVPTEASRPFAAAPSSADPAGAIRSALSIDAGGM